MHYHLSTIERHNGTFAQSNRRTQDQTNRGNCNQLSANAKSMLKPLSPSMSQRRAKD